MIVDLSSSRCLERLPAIQCLIVSRSHPWPTNLLLPDHGCPMDPRFHPAVQASDAALHVGNPGKRRLLAMTQWQLRLGAHHKANVRAFSAHRYFMLLRKPCNLTWYLGDGGLEVQPRV